MKKQAMKHWNNILGKGIGVSYVETDWIPLNKMRIVRLLTQEENELYKFDSHEIYAYDSEHKCAVNTRAPVIDLQTGEILNKSYGEGFNRICYKHLYWEHQCRKMYIEYSKIYFDKFEDKILLRKRYKRAVELWDWYKNEYDGRYDYMKLKINNGL